MFILPLSMAVFCQIMTFLGVSLFNVLVSY